MDTKMGRWGWWKEGKLIMNYKKKGLVFYG